MESPLRQHRVDLLHEPLTTIAERGDLHISQISAVERGLPCPPRRYPAFAKAYKLSVDEFKRLVGASSVGDVNRGKERRPVRNARRVSA